MDDIRTLWERCIDFHGHSCTGLLTGFMAALHASDLLSLRKSEDEGIVCISENDACGIDALQVVLGCTAGRGNLLFHMTGKIAYSFYSRESGHSVRLIARGRIPGLDGMDIVEYCSLHSGEELFEAMDTRIPLPERARIFDSYICDGCGELAGANWMHLQNGKKLCPDCYVKYDRFRI